MIKHRTGRMTSRCNRRNDAITNKTSICGSGVSNFERKPPSVNAPPPRDVVSRHKQMGIPPPPATVYNQREAKQADEVERIRQVAEKLKLGSKKKKVSL